MQTFLPTRRTPPSSTDPRRARRLSASVDAITCKRLAQKNSLDPSACLAVSNYADETPVWRMKHAWLFGQVDEVFNKMVT